MRFDRPLGPGAQGGHGPIAYRVDRYEPGRCVRFRFTRSPVAMARGLEGVHWFAVHDRGPAGATVEHVLEGRARGTMRLFWPLVFRPLHDALIRDALDRAELAATGRIHARAAWSGQVVALRWILRRAGLGLRRSAREGRAEPAGERGEREGGRP
jgi:hypothetical protein